MFSRPFRKHRVVALATYMGICKIGDIIDIKRMGTVQKGMSQGPAFSIMTMSLDSHVVDRGSHPGPSGLKLSPGACACVPKIPRGEWRRDCGVAIPPGGDLSLSVSLSLSVWRAHTPYSKILSKKTPHKIKNKTHAEHVCVRTQDPERRME